MGYSPKMCPAGESTARAENHWKVTFDVVELKTGDLIEESVTRTVMNDDVGNQTIVYKGEKFKVNRLQRQKSGNLKLGQPRSNIAKKKDT